MSINIATNVDGVLNLDNIFSGITTPVTLMLFAKVDAWPAGTTGHADRTLMRILNDAGTNFGEVYHACASSNAQPYGQILAGTSSFFGTTRPKSESAGIWVPMAVTFTNSTNRTLRFYQNGVLTSVSSTTTRDITSLNDLVLFSGSYTVSARRFACLHVLNQSINDTQFDEFRTTGTIAGASILQRWDALTDWGAGNILSANGGVNITPPVAWTYSSDNPNFSSVTIGSSPANTRTTESRTIRITVPTTAPTTVNTNIKINSAGNAAITPTACTLVSGLTYDITFTVPDAYAGLPYSSTGYPIIVTTTDGTATSGNVPYLPVTGNDFVNPTVAVPGDIVVLSGTFGTDDQLEYGTAGGTVSIDTSCVITYTGANPAGVSFSVRAWDNLDDTWGSFATMSFGGSSGGGGGKLSLSIGLGIGI